MASSVLFCLNLLCFAVIIIGAHAQNGSWQVLNQSIGISCMHAAVTRWNTCVCLDRTNTGPSNSAFPPNHPCRNNTDDLATKIDCTAHSCAFDFATNQCRPLMIQTDTWCSSGQFLSNGSLLQTGGWRDGSNMFRIFDPCVYTGSCDWYEYPNTTLQLFQPRWYASNQVLDDGVSVIIVGGISQNSVEYYGPRRSRGAVNFPFLGEVGDNQGDNLYPYVHLLPNGRLFIFANTQYVLYNFADDTYISQKNLPALPGGPRNYPSAGSSCMLPLEGDYSMATIVICGGAQPGAFNNANTTLPGQKSCGRINATDNNPSWEMDDMPEARIMGEMVMLPTGDVCIINGARAGSQGFGLATDPSYSPFLYQYKNPLGSRFRTLNPTTTPRLYHSTANLMPNGCIMVAGSNSHWAYTFTNDYSTTVLSVESFCPDYSWPNNPDLVPTVVKHPGRMQYGKDYNVYFNVSSLAKTVEVNIVSAPYSTHSFSQGQRLVKLIAQSNVTPGGNNGQYRIVVKAPPSGMVAPPAYYMFFLINGGVPSKASWVPIGT